jgi:spermidine dehydrogenase
MDANDGKLGMGRNIYRRDFLNGMALAIGASVAPRALWAQNAGPDTSAQEPLLAQGITPSDPRYYPPALTGMRGSHPGSFEAAHELRDNHRVDLSGATDTHEAYDLVVVGGGMSGLAAAHYFVKNVGRSAKVLVLDNHDDFGGHAKRNEFRHNGRLLALNGGTLNIESPERYNLPARQLLADIGVDLERYLAANASNRQLYNSLGLGSSYFFDKETWGSDRLIKNTPAAGGGGAGVGGRGGRGGITPDFVSQTPLSEQGKKDLIRLYDRQQPDYLPGLSSDEKKEQLSKISYTDFLLNFAKFDKQVLWFVQHTGEGNFCVGADAIPALFAWQMGSPGFAGMNIDPTPDGVLADLPGGQHGRQKPGGGAVHFPDGNATLARLLVRWLIPEAVPGKTMEDSGVTRVDYTRLDRAGQTARIRLNSTVLNVQHEGGAASVKKSVLVSYSNAGKLYQVRGRFCVLACWNTMIPYMIPDLPQRQKEALAYGVKGPLVYTSVALRNWTSFQKLGLRSVSAPTMYHDSVALSEAASLGELQHPQTPDDPIVLHLTKIPNSPGKPRKEQHVIGRTELYTTTFETFERKIRDQLARTLGAGGFDPARDIVAITVNRWPHGYAYTYNTLYEPAEWVYTSSNNRPCVIARQPFGSIAIANSDAAASPHTDAAFLEAHRAVEEVLERRTWPLI